VWFHISVDEVELVRHYLRGQNLEQLGRTEEAIALYEQAVAGGFDSTGPYDRLIVLYGHLARHPDVIRICEAALVHVRTYDDKRTWYERMRSEARQAGSKVPKATPKNQS
jgi:tetratricopeptide (TPR) repeat protein